MNARQEAKLNMYRATQQHCIDNDTILRTVPAFAITLTAFNTKVSAIISTAQQEDLVTKGITIGKAEAKTNLCRLAADIGASVYAFAVANHNRQLQQEVNFSFSDLLRTKDDILAPRVQNIKDLANVNLPDLLSYGLTDASLDAFQSAIDDYQQKVPAPRNSVAHKATIRENLKTLFAEADAVLRHQMDKTLTGFKSTHPGFVSTYKVNRIIIDPGSAATTLKLTITGSNDSFVPAASILVNGVSFKTTTTEKGGYQIKPIAAGTADIEVSAPGYVTQMLPAVKIKQGQTTALSITLNTI
jgi:hypothetical protein